MQKSKSALGCLVLIVIAGLAWIWMTSGPEQPQVRLIGPGAYAMIIPPETAGADLPQLARTACTGKAICSAYGWARAEDAASALPMLEAEAARQTFSYAINRSTGFERALWNCTVYPRRNPDECLAN